MIKNFIYLDEYKMYSLSSQLFEGITDYLINTNTHCKDQSEQQKGPYGSGRILANILSKEYGTTEKKYLHDYAYVLFEQHLIDSQQVFDVNDSDFDTFSHSIESLPFIKIKGKAIFNDIESIKNTIKNFNNFAKAIAYVTNYGSIQEIKKQLEQAKGKSKNKSKSILDANIAKVVQESGLQHDQKFLENLEFLLSYGFQDQFEIQIECSDHIYSANLKRESLREKEELLIRKYSRKTEVDFIIFGMVAQYVEKKESELPEVKSDFKSIKEAVMNLVSNLSNIETTFTGRLSNEIVVDPIAVYLEL